MVNKFGIHNKFGETNFFFFQFNSAAQSCLTLCNSMDSSTPGLPIHHQLPELAHTHVHRVGDASNHLFFSTSLSRSTINSVCRYITPMSLPTLLCTYSLLHTHVHACTHTRTHSRNPIWTILTSRLLVYFLQSFFFFLANM